MIALKIGIGIYVAFVLGFVIHTLFAWREGENGSSNNPRLHFHAQPFPAVRGSRLGK